MRWRAPMALGALWVAAAALATGVGLVAVGMVAGEVGGQSATPLTDDKVREALKGAAPVPSPSATPTRTSTPTATSPPRSIGALRTVHTSGGVVSARCEDRAPNLLYASPSDGWRTDRSRDTIVRFVRSGESVTVQLSCSGAQLLTSTRTEDQNDDSPSPAASPDDSGSPEPSDSPEPDHSDEPSDNPSSGSSGSDG